jgi:protein-tyrosine-phosphatase/DNA-binding transcriptional ArsR family regulator
MYREEMSLTPSLETPAAPPGVLRLTGHPVRWQLLHELARSDRQVRELVELVGQRQSLTSYHLSQLREGGLVAMRRSSADKRDTYYSLDLLACREQLADAGAALHPGMRLAPAAPMSPTAEIGLRRSGRPARVLFLCTGNSARSQMAEALLERRVGTGVEAVSAGSHPKPLHSSAVRVMRESGIDISGRHSKPLSLFVDQRFDHIISLCDRVREICPTFPGSPTMAHWSLADPAAEARADGDDYAPFLRSADELKVRIDFLLHAIHRATTSPERG